MHVYPARIITPDKVWSPSTAQELPDGTFVVHAKDGTLLALVNSPTVVMAPADTRAILGTERLWIVTGTVDGEPIRWAVMLARGCGCGGTAETPPTDADLEVLQPRAAV